MAITLSDVLTEHWESYAHSHRSELSAAHYRAVRCVLSCRTAVMGGRLYRCGCYRRYHYAYHSCNHRSCPKCGALDQQIWAAKQEAKLLPVPYFMVTFTLPDSLRYLCLAYPAILYDLMIRESAAALQDVVATKYKGGRLGILSVLQSWGRQIQHHPHIHCIVPAVVFDDENLRLKHPPKGEFLVQYRPLAARFRSRIYTALKEQHPEIFSALTPEAREALRPGKQWNVDLQPVGKGVTALRYLAAYVRRSAFSEKRLLGYDRSGRLRVKWKCSETGATQVMALHPHEFIRRWLLHVLPKGFARIRYYGYLASAATRSRIKVRLLLGEGAEPEAQLPLLEAFACQHCGEDLKFVAKIPRVHSVFERGPPGSS